MRDIPVEQLAKLFQPFPFGEGALRNRIVMAPMTRCFCPQGVPGPEVAKYYERRASGGAGLLITEGTYIDHPAANGYRDVPAFFGSALGGWSQVVQSVHGQGALIVPQLWHVGPVRRPAMGPVIGVPGVGPRAVWEDGALVVESMTRQAIGEVIGSFARAARAARECGFDGVEIHGAHGYLLDEFLWDQSNRRTDEYGGSLENRARLSLEVVDAIRQAAGPGFQLKSILESFEEN